MKICWNLKVTEMKYKIEIKSMLKKWVRYENLPEIEKW